VPESLLDESVRRVLRDKFALGLFDDPYVPEDPVQIRAVASEGDDLSRRLAAESVTLLKNEKNLLPFSRDIKNVAVIGPHADSTMVGFPAYTYPAALAMIRARFTGEEIAMAGADTGSGNIPSEAQAAMVAEMQDYLKVNLDDYVRSNYPAVSLAEAVRKLLPNAKVSAVAGTGIMPSAPTDIPAAVAAAREADAVILYIGGHAAWAGKDRTEGEGTDSANIDLPPQQVELVKAVTAVGKPTVAVISMGRPQGLAPVIDRLPAVLTAYYGGPHQGAAIPAQQLIGFARLDLEPGASKTVSFVVPMSLLAYTGMSGELVVEPGPVEVSAGSSSSDLRSTARFTVTGKTRAFKGEERAFLSAATVGS
jgi:beta-glucosidase